MIDWLRRRRREDAAGAWYARMAQPTSEQEVEAFEAWLARDPENARVYAEVDAVWRASGAADPARPARPSSGWGRTLRPAIAVGLAVLAIVAFVVVSQGAAPPAYAAIANDGVALRGVKLTDGTVVWLDVGARIGVRMVDGQRDIAVRRGRVRIAPGSAVPVTVTAQATRVMPGTAPIDVTVSAGGVEVSALEAPLEVSAAAADGASPITVGKGQAIVLSGNAVRPAEPDRTWPTGRVRFAAARLDAIVRLANRYGDPDLAVPDKDVAALAVSGVFDLRDTRRLARKLAVTFDLRVDAEDDRIILRR